MTRISRREQDGNYFHVMVQGIGKEYIFLSDESKGYYLRCLQRNIEKYPVKILAFCVMGNHAHVLLSVKDIEELSKFMQYTNADYSVYYNHIKERVGYVFRGRYRSELIQDEKQLVYCMAYIQNNPLKAGIVDRAENYRYSSYSNYLAKSGIVDFEEASRFYDISPESIQAIMRERTDSEWMEHDDKDYENKYEVLEELVRRYKIPSGQMIRNKELVIRMGLELKERCGSSLREIATLLGMGRETLRKWLSGVVNS